MPRDPFIREKFTRERTAAKKLAAEYFERFPKDRYQTEVESWRHLQSQKYRIHYEAAARAGRGRGVNVEGEAVYSRPVSLLSISSARAIYSLANFRSSVCV